MASNVAASARSVAALALGVVIVFGFAACDSEHASKSDQTSANHALSDGKAPGEDASTSRPEQQAQPAGSPTLFETRLQNGYRQLTKARGMSERAPQIPSHHYLFEGEATFRFKAESDDQEPREIIQSLSIHLAGADRIVYTLEAGRARNLFLLERWDRGWQRSGTRGTWQANDNPRDLAQDTWMRWLVCRFPWDQRQELGALEELPQLRADGSRRWSSSGPFGEFELQLDEEGRPVGLALSQGPRLELSGGRALPSGVWMPSEWTWSYGSLTRIERFSMMLDNGLFFDRAFRPPDTDPPSSSWIATDYGDQSRPVREELGLVRRARVQVLEGPDRDDWFAALLAEGKIQKLSWTLVHEDGRRTRVAVLAGEVPDSLPTEVEVRTVPAGIYLRWVCWNGIGSDEGLERLRQTARRNRYSVGSPAWFLRQAADSRRREFLLPIES